MTMLDMENCNVYIPGMTGGDAGFHTMMEDEHKLKENRQQNVS